MIIKLDGRRPPPTARARVGQIAPATYQWALRLAGKEKHILPNTSSAINFGDFVEKSKDLHDAEVTFEIRAFVGAGNEYSIEVQFRQGGNLVHDPAAFTRDGTSSTQTIVFRRLTLFDVSDRG